MILKLALKHLLSKPFLSVFTLIAISGSLTVLGSFWTVVENLERVRVKATSSQAKDDNVGLTLYVDSKMADGESFTLKKKLADDKRFQNVAVISPEEALKSLESQFGEALSKAFSSEGMPTTVKLTFAESTLSREDYLILLNEMRSLPGVLDIDDGFSLMPTRSSAATSPVLSWATALLVFVFSVVALLVSHLIRIAFETLRPEVETLKVLGASKFWIFKPLILEGLFFGIFGALGSLCFLALGIHVLLPKIQSVILPQGFSVVALSSESSLGLIGISIFASVVGALFTWPLIEKPATDI